MILAGAAAALALPGRARRWRRSSSRRTSSRSSYGRKAWFTNSLNYYLSSLFFNAFPLPQREAGTRQTLRYIGELVGDGYSVLIFPEGRRTEDGEIARFQPGVGMIASRLDVPVVPVRLEGLDRVLHHTWKFPTRGPARVRVRRAYVIERQRLRRTGRAGRGGGPRACKAEFTNAWPNVAQSLIGKDSI